MADKQKGLIKYDKSESWMEGVSVINDALLNDKGVVKELQEPVEVETKFGMRKATTAIIEGEDGVSIQIRLFLPPQFPMLHIKSTMAKILRQYDCEGLDDLIGKEVEVIQVNERWQIKVQ